ncbi:Dynein light chain [Fragilaria crotonensis]|nr:Dynein light chain [Fragilaria crotonensis]
MSSSSKSASKESPAAAALPAVKAASSSLEEVESTVSRLSSHKGVQGVMILSEKGEIVHSTFPPESEVEQAKILVKIKRLSSSLFHDTEEEVSFIRIRTQQHELLVSPNNDYLLVVLHNPLVSSVEKEL